MAAARPPIDVPTFTIFSDMLNSRNNVSKPSLAIPGPQIITGIEEEKTRLVSLATLLKNSDLTAVESFPHFPPPLMLNDEMSLMPCFATSNRRTSSFSTTISPTRGLLPSRTAELIRSKSGCPIPPSLEISISEPISMVCVW